MKIALFGSYGEGNLGDEAICSAVIADIKNIYPDAEILLFSHDVEDSMRRHGKNNNLKVRPMIATGFRSLIKQMKSSMFKESLNELKECNLVIIGGGGLFYDSEVSVGVNPILIWLIRVLIFRYLKLKIVLYGLGVGPIKSFISKKLLKILGNMVHSITVRDKYSEDILKSCKIYTPIVISADPVWGTVWETRTMQDINKTPMLKYDAKNKLGIQLRKVKGMKETEFITLMAEFIDIMIDKYLLSVALIPMSSRDPDDRLLLEKIQVKVRNENHVEIVDTKKVTDVPNVMQECDVLILSRMHSIIMASNLGIPYIALSYSPKTDDLLYRLEMTECAWPVFDAEATILERLYLKLMKKKVTIKTHLKNRSNDLLECSKSNKELLLYARES